MPSICVFGAGAIGGLVAAKLEAAGTPVNIVARGAHLEAIRANGLTLRSGGETIVTHPTAIVPEESRPQDYLILAVKAQALGPALPALRPLIGPRTAIVPAVNGIPWWYSYKLGNAYANRIVRAVDPGGALWAALPPGQVIGAVVYPAAEIAAPGVIAHTYGDRISLGEPDGSVSARATALAEIFVAAGLRAPARGRVRDEIWVKLLGNMAFNPVSVLTGTTLDRILDDPSSLATVRTLMREGQAVGSRLGASFAIGVEKRIAGVRAVGAHKTSMLQDFEAGRTLEIDALLGAVVELAGWVGVPVPVATRVLAEVRAKAAARG